MQQPLLEIDNLSIAFHQQGITTTVVDGLSLSLNAGETLALVGESALPGNHCCTPARRHCEACAVTALR